MKQRNADGLRYGWTTGTCAAGAAGAAGRACLGLAKLDPVPVILPRGGGAAMPLAELEPVAGGWRAGIVKDAGDDPDVTHGCLVRAAVLPAAPGSGVAFRAGEGVGTVTRPGLALAPGEPAINPVPRAMIAGELERLALAVDAPADFVVELSIPGGADLAKATLNARLGIAGGLSILGTTGIVTPYSCAAWVHSIHRGIDVARAVGLKHLVAATGRASERAAQQHLGLPETALIEMGDFVGATLKYLRRHPVPRLTLAGGFAKLAKLAQGHLDLHSGRSRLDTAPLVAALCEAGIDPATGLDGEPSGGAILAAARAAGLPLADTVAAAALAAAAGVLEPADTALSVLIVDRTGTIVGRAGLG